MRITWEPSPRGVPSADYPYYYGFGRINAYKTLNSLAPLTVRSISPSSEMQMPGVFVTTTIVGSGFQQGATVVLQMGGHTIPTTVTFVSSNQLKCTFELSGAVGYRDVVVTNPAPPDGNGLSGTKTGGFQVTPYVPPRGCGGGSASTVVAFGLFMGLLSAGGGLRRRFSRRRAG